MPLSYSYNSFILFTTLEKASNKLRTLHYCLLKKWCSLFRDIFCGEPCHITATHHPTSKEYGENRVERRVVEINKNEETEKGVRKGK
jgi:hypothetical protein